MDNFKSLNFAGDQQLESRLEEVRKQFLGKTAEDSREIVERFGQMGARRFNLAA